MRTNRILFVVVLLLVLSLVVGGGYVLLSQAPPGGEGDGVVVTPPDGNGDPAAPGPEDPPDAASDGGDGGLPPPGRREGTVVKPPAKDGAWLSIAPFERTLDEIDWEFVGKTYAELVPLLNDRANSAYRGDAEGTESNPREEALYMGLVKMEDRYREEFGGVREYRIMLHPAVMSNAVAATLYARRRGLTEEQLALLRSVAVRYTAEDQQLRTLREEAEEPDIEITVEKDAEVARRRRAYLREVETILDAEQRALLHSDIARERRWLDAFGAGNCWMRPVDIVHYEDPKKIGDHFKVRMIGGLHHKVKPLVEESIDRILARLPAGRFEPRHRLIDLMGWVHVDDVLFGCDLTAEMVRGYAAAVRTHETFHLEPGQVDVPMVPLRDPGE